MSSKNSIAKNTFFLYIRMFLTMGVTLFTSRVVLNTLGVEDYGIYNVVGGLVVLFTFFNSAMSSATQRYLSFDIGQEDSQKLKKTFNSTLLIHVGIALLILCLAETIGVWYLSNILNVSPERQNAVFWVFQFSIFTTLLSIIQVPYNALIIAREKMSVYAVVSLLDVVLKLLAVYFLLLIHFDKLILYSILVFCVAFITTMIYRIYCSRNFEESKLKLYKDKKYYKELISYSGWNLFGNIAAVAKGQGVNLVLNLIFGTIVNAAYGIAMQVQAAVSLFSNNIQLAFAPQIVKRYSTGDIRGTQKLIITSAKISFFLMALISAPILLNTKYILGLWLKTPPPHSVSFVQLCLLNVLLECVSRPLMTGAQATGRIKWYQIVVGSLIFLNLPISYALLKVYENPNIVFIVSLVISFLSLQFRLFFLKKLLKFDVYQFHWEVTVRSAVIFMITYVIFYIDFLTLFTDCDSFVSFLVYTVTLSIFICFLILTIGVTNTERRFLLDFVKKKMK